MKFGQRWKTKPPPGTPLDTTHPWVGPYNWRLMYALNEGSGGTIVDGMRNLNLEATGFGTTNPWGVGSQGGIQCGSGSLYVGTTLPASLRLSLPITVGAAFRPQQLTSTNTTLFGIPYANPLAYPYWSCNLLQYANVVAFSWSDGGSQMGLEAAFTSTNADIIAIGVLTSTFQALYLNGVLAASSTVANSNPTYSSSSQIGFGALAGQSNPNCTYYWGFLANAAFPASMNAAIGAGGNPNNLWQIYEPMISRAWISLPGGFNLSASEGSYGLIGDSAGLYHGRAIDAVEGSYGLTGDSASLYVGFTLFASEGSYGLAGDSAALLYGRWLESLDGQYLLNGSTATLSVAYPASIDYGLFGPDLASLVPLYSLDAGLAEIDPDLTAVIA